MRGIAIVFLLVGPVLANAQDRAPSRRLMAPDAMLDAEFVRVSAMRELGDGRVVVVDAGSTRLVVADFTARTTRTIGRIGGGATEHGAALRALYALGGDTSLVPDPANGRWLLLHRDAIATLIGADAPVVRAIGLSPSGVDTLGSVIGTRPRVVDGVPRLDSLLLLRGSRRRGTLDTLSRLFVRPPTFIGGGRVDPTRPAPVAINPLSANEQAVMFPDGWVAIARLAPYRVEWIEPGGARRIGSELPFIEVRLDDAERAAALRREADETGRPVRDPLTVGEWPRVVPPFLNNGLLAATDGSLWVLRAPARNQQDRRYDVVDRRGVLAEQVVLDKNERVVGFGARSVYTVITDNDGIQRLRRHPRSSR